MWRYVTTPARCSRTPSYICETRLWTNTGFYTYIVLSQQLNWERQSLYLLFKENRASDYFAAVVESDAQRATTWFKWIFRQGHKFQGNNL